jgi:hypothetical protein
VAVVAQVLSEAARLQARRVAAAMEPHRLFLVYRLLMPEAVVALAITIHTETVLVVLAAAVMEKKELQLLLLLARLIRAAVVEVVHIPALAQQAAPASSSSNTR